MWCELVVSIWYSNLIMLWLTCLLSGLDWSQGAAGHKISTDPAVTIHQYRKCTELICNYTNSYQRLPVLINPITVTEVTMGLVTGDVIVTAWILMGTLAWVGASVRYFPVCTMTATTRPPDPDQSEMPSRYANWRLLVVLPSSELGSHFCRGYF